MRAPSHPQEAERLQALADYDIIDTPAESDFDDVVALASRICETKVSLVSLVDESRQWFKAKHGFDEEYAPRDFAICDHALLQDELLEIHDTTEDPRTTIWWSPKEGCAFTQASNCGHLMGWQSAPCACWMTSPAA